MMQSCQVCGISIPEVVDAGCRRRSIPEDRVWCHRGLVVQAAETRGDRGEDVAIAVDGLEDKAWGAAVGVAGGLLA